MPRPSSAASSPRCAPRSVGAAPYETYLIPSIQYDRFHVACMSILRRNSPQKKHRCTPPSTHKHTGVDPLASNKGFWAQVLGVGDFYYELAVQV